MLIHNHFLVISSVQYTLAFTYLFIFWKECFSQGRDYDNMVISDLTKGGLESGVWIDEYN